jgi:hypothetical protein
VCALAVVTLAGCNCDPSHTVPFGLDAGARVNRGPSDPAPIAARPRARLFDEGTQRLEIEGAPIEAGASIRALWTDDVDADGDRDALLLVHAPAALRVAFARRDGAAFAALRDLGSAPGAPEGCTLDQPALDPLGARWLVARARITCAEPGRSRREEWVLLTDRTPRLLEHFALLDAAGRAPGTVELTFAPSDRDEDGIDDLLVTLSVASGGAPSAVELPWLDRPSGRARDALRKLRGEPAAALSESRDVVAIHAALCREPGLARVRIGDSDGLACGTSDAAARAATTIVRAHAAQGRILEALDAAERLETPGYAMNEERRQSVRDAIASAPATPGVTLREGPAHIAPEMQIARLSALAFVDEDHLLLRGEPSRVFDLASGTTQDVPNADLRILDPGGAYAVAAVERRCAGHVVRVVPAQAIVFGQALGATHSLPLVSPRDPPAGAPCPDLTPALRRDDGGFRVLAWAPQGVVVARGTDVSVVPLDVSARPAGDPEVLAPGTPPPAPLAPGAITADGRFLAEVRGIGVVVHRLAPSFETALLWPEGWASREGDVAEPAVSPSGNRAAVLRGGRVLILERR